MPIELTCDPAPEDAAALSRGIADFNRATIPDLEPNEAEVRFHVLARGDDDALTGGIRASCYWNTLHIELLWLSEDARGSGTGRALLQRAESFAQENGCGKAFVETTSWQARPFYEANGYVHMATLPDRPKGHASHYLGKTLGG